MPYALVPGEGSPVFRSENGHLLRLQFTSASALRVTFTQGRPFLDKPSLIVTRRAECEGWALREKVDCFEFYTAKLRVVLDRATGALSYFNGQGRPLFAEPARGGRWLTPRPVLRNVYDSTVGAATGQNIDGARSEAKARETVVDREAFEAKLEFVFSPGEALHGLGSYEEGIGNLRGKAREMYQQNMKAVVPFLISTNGYGVLLDCCSLMSFHDDEFGSYWWADVVDELEYHVIAGESFDEITAEYHALTGTPPLLPRWAFGYAQSKERYVNARELVDVVKEYRRREIPLDLIVLDWKSWPNGSGWGQKSFDTNRFPDPQALTEELHALGAKLMVSVWPIMTGGCENQKELLDRGLMLGNQATYDAFNPEARDCYWQQARRGLFDKGVDAWWCDCTEPFEADWSGAVKPEVHKRLALNTAQSKLYLDEGLINAYSLLHSQGIYEGQRKAGSSKRVVNLTRSSYAGQHRYATITWNGDICATWETLRRCIPEGLNFIATGEPWWTVDIGGFFINNDPKLWFWRGDYAEGCRGLTDMNALEPDPADTGCSDLGFHELYTRWVQYAAFLPMFRSHGTDAAREAWRFGEPGDTYHDTIVAHIRLRYRFIHYTYSCAAAVTREGRMMLRPLSLAFPADQAGHAVNDQFLFGPSLLVCPVTQPMYHGPGSKVLSGVPKVRSVYLPAGSDWFDFHTGKRLSGGQTIETAAPIELIPLFVKAGAILPLTESARNADEAAAGPLEIRIYPGADTSFTLYEDAGDGYEYEQGAFALTRFTWTDSDQRLDIQHREGSYPGMPLKRALSLRLLTEDKSLTRQVTYTGSGLEVTFA